MKNIFLSIQDQLADNVPALQYIDKNWGQLNIPQPPVKWPCCLIDLDSIDYSQGTDRCRIANASISITIADQHITRSSAKASAKDDAFAILDVIEDVIDALEGYRVPSTTQALTRTRLQKAYSDQSYDVYTLTFSAAWIEQTTEEGQAVNASPSIAVQLVLPSE